MLSTAIRNDFPLPSINSCSKHILICVVACTIGWIFENLEYPFNSRTLPTLGTVPGTPELMLDYNHEVLIGKGLFVCAYPTGTLRDPAVLEVNALSIQPSSNTPARKSRNLQPWDGCDT